MGELTDFLPAYNLTGLPTHPDHPALVLHPNCKTFALRECGGCPQKLKTNHKSYEFGYLTAALDPQYIPDLTGLWSMQYLVDRSADDLTIPYGSETGWLVNGKNSLNFNDRIGWNVISVSDNTVTCAPQAGNAKEQIIYQFRVGNTQAPFGYTTISVTGPPQANDLGEIDAPSCLANTNWFRVLKVEINEAGTQVVFHTDHDLTNLMYSGDPDNPSPGTFTIRTWRQAGDRKQWFPVIAPSAMVTVPRYDVFRKPAAGWGDGKLVLKRADGTEAAIAWPVAGCDDDTKVAQDTLTVKLKVSGVGDLSDISSSVANQTRVKYEKTGSGPDGKGMYRVTLCLGNEDAYGDPASPLIDSDTQVVYVHYHVEATQHQRDTQPQRCFVPCGRRCKNSVRVPGDSTYGSSQGIATDADGQVWMCKKKWGWVLTENGDGTWTKTEFQPSHLADYAPDCRAYNCDFFVPIEDAAEGERPFNIWGSSALYFRNLIMSPWIMHKQLFPGENSYLAQQISCIGNPSLLGLHGQSNKNATLGWLQNPIGWHPTITFPRFGMGLVGNFDTLVTAGDTRFNPLAGAWWDDRSDWTAIALGDDLTYPGPGVFPSLVSGWTTKTDALGNALDDTNDPYKSLRYYPSLTSYRLHRDTGVQEGRSLERYISTPTGNEQLLLPQVNPDTLDEEQDLLDYTVQFFSTPQTGPNGFMYDGLIQVLPLTATGKEPHGDVVTGTVESVSVAGGIATIELSNQERVWSYLVTTGDESWDEQKVFISGGKNIDPPDWMQVRSVYDLDSSVGGTGAKATVGDAIKFAYTPTGFAEFSDVLFTIKEAIAYGGAVHSTWGNNKLPQNFEPTGYFKATAANFDLGTGFNGYISGASGTASTGYSSSATSIVLTARAAFCANCYVKNTRTGEVVKVNSNDDAPTPTLGITRGQLGTSSAAILANDVFTLVVVRSGSTIYTADTHNTRPASLAAGTYWIDKQRNRIYWSASNLGATVDVAYYVAGKDVLGTSAYVETGHVIGAATLDGTAYTVPAFDTGLANADYGSLTRVVNVEGVVVSDSGGSAPAANQYQKTTDGSGHVVLKFHADNAGRSCQITYTLVTTTAAPGDVADAPGYSSDAWGKKHDLIRVYDDNGWIAANASALVGTTFTITRNEAVLHPAYTPVLQQTPYLSDSYATAVASTDYVCERGRGRFYLAPAYTAALRS